MSERFIRLETTVNAHNDRLDSLEDWRSELRGAYRLVTIAFGASIVSAILAIVAIIQILHGAAFNVTP